MSIFAYEKSVRAKLHPSNVASGNSQNAKSKFDKSGCNKAKRVAAIPQLVRLVWIWALYFDYFTIASNLGLIFKVISFSSKNKRTIGLDTKYLIQLKSEL